MTEFKFTTTLYEYDEVYPHAGKITYGDVSIGVYIADFNGDDLHETLFAIYKMMNGHNTVKDAIFNLTDGTTSFNIKDDVFTLNWGVAFDTINCSKLECSYSKNKKEINKFMKYLFDNYSSVLLERQFYVEYRTLKE